MAGSLVRVMVTVSSIALLSVLNEFRCKSPNQSKLRWKIHLNIFFPQWNVQFYAYISCNLQYKSVLIGKNYSIYMQKKREKPLAFHSNHNTNPHTICNWNVIVYMYLFIYIDVLEMAELTIIIIIINIIDWFFLVFILQLNSNNARHEVEKLRVHRNQNVYTISMKST